MGVGGVIVQIDILLYNCIFQVLIYYILYLIY